MEVFMNFDVIIIGAGPGGIFSAYELVKLNPGMKVAVFEAGHALNRRRCPIDGEKVNKDDIVAIGDALLGVRVTEGSHTVTFKYMPEGLLLGAILSVLALTTVLLLLFIKKKGWFSFDPELYVETVTEEIDAIDAIDAFDANSNIVEENVSSEEQNNETLEE